MSNIGHNKAPEFTIVTWINMIMERQDLSPKAKHIAHIIREKWDVSKRCADLTIDDLVHFTGWSKSTILRHRDELEKAHISIQNSTGRTATSYKSDVILEKSTVSGRHGSVSQPCQTDTQRCQGDTVKPSNGVRVTLLNLPTVSDRHPLTADSRPPAYINKKIKKIKIKNNYVAKKQKQKKQKDSHNALRDFAVVVEGLKNWILLDGKHGDHISSFEFKSMSENQRKNLLDQQSNKKAEKQLEAWLFAYDEDLIKRAYAATIKAELGDKKQISKIGYMQRMLEVYAKEDREKIADKTQDEIAWGWWKDKGFEAYKALGVKHWQNMLDQAKPNGTWPVKALGPPPGHPECLIPEQLQTQFYGKYQTQVENLIKQFGGHHA